MNERRGWEGGGLCIVLYLPSMRITDFLDEAAFERLLWLWLLLAAAAAAAAAAATA